MLTQPVDGGIVLQSDGAAAVLGGFSIILLLLSVVVLAGMWKVFTKAGQPGWAAIIPIYNIVVLLQIVGRPVWWIILLFIPVINMIISILVLVDLAKAFGKGIGFAIGLMFLSVVFVPLLGFGDAQYQGAPN